MPPPANPPRSRPTTPVARRLLAGLWLGLLGAVTPGWAADGSGQTFSFAFQRNHPDKHPGDHAYLRLYIAALTGASGAVSIPGLGFRQTVTVAPQGLAEVEPPLAAKSLPDNAAADLAVEVTLDAPATVYGINRLRASTDAFLALPEDALGRDYRVLAYRSTNGRSQVAITATADATTVLVRPAGSVRGVTSGEPLRLQLDRGQVYSLVGATAAADLTGTTISASAPIAVQAGAECANVPPRAGTCDHLVEMLPPLGAWGRRFLTRPLATRLKGDLLRVLADQDGTALRIDGELVATLGAGKVFERMQRAPALLEASAPVLVGQYAVGTSVDQITSDPFFVLVPPLEQYLDQYVFATPESGFRGNFVNIIIPDPALATLRLDDQPLAADAGFAPIGETGFSTAALPLAPGSHRLRADAPFGITIYGFDQADSYGYPGGMGLAHINPAVPALPETPPPPPSPPPRLGAQVPIQLGTLARREERRTTWAPTLLGQAGPVPLSVIMGRLDDGTRIELDTGAGWQRLDGRTLTIAHAPHAPPWSLRTRTDGCAGPIEPGQFSLRLALPGGDSASVPILLRVLQTPWWRCLLPWLIALAVLVTLGLILWGLLSPARFPRQLGVQLADEEDVDQGFFLLLRAQAGTGTGLYRDARAYVRADFRVCGQPSGAVARLRAGRGLVYIQPMRGAAVQWQNAEGDWEPLPTHEVPARVGTPYRSESGALYFMLKTR